MEHAVLAAALGLVLAAVWAALKGLRAASSCCAFCAATLGLAFVIERGASAAADRAAEAADQGVAAALSSWGEENAPPSGRVLTFFISDELDGDDDSGAGPSWADALRAAVGRLLGAPSERDRLGLQVAGSAIDWRTQTLAWASDRDAQYDALSRVVADAKKAGVRVQVIARGRGADAVLGGLRRGGARPDRVLIVGRAPGAGDEMLAADVAFVYKTPRGVEAAYTDASGAFARVPGRSVGELVSGFGGAISGGAPFRSVVTAAVAAPLSTTIGSAIAPWAP